MHDPQRAGYINVYMQTYNEFLISLQNRNSMTEIQI